MSETTIKLMMRKLILLCASISLFFVACTNEKEHIVSSHPNGKPAFVEYFTDCDTINPVRSLRYYFSGEKQEQTSYSDGVKNGSYVFWYPNGEKMFEGSYKNGVLDGTFTQWYDNGKVDYIAKYENGRPSGTWEYYSKEGKLLSKQKMQ